MLVRPETKNPLVIHLGLVLAEAICISAFYVEIRRAIGGNRLSWAYVFEWPIFAAYGVYVWKKLLSDEPRGDDSEHDESLAAYNEYLRRVHGDGGDDVEPPASP